MSHEDLFREQAVQSQILAAVQTQTASQNVFKEPTRLKCSAETQSCSVAGPTKKESLLKKQNKKRSNIKTQRSTAHVRLNLKKYILLTFKLNLK